LSRASPLRPLRGGRGERLRERARRLRAWLFPPRLELPEATRCRLSALYPALDLDRVSFHRGLPHFLRGVAHAMALPAPLSPSRCRIYIHGWLWEPETDDGFSLLAHEAFHALQMQEAGPGLGLVRPFIILYLACAARNGFLYRGHPMEEDAYAVAGRRRSRVERALAAGEEPVPVPASGVAFWRKLAASTPGGAALAPLWLLAWSSATAVLWLAKLAVEGAGALAVAAAWGLGASATGLDRARQLAARFSK
jgi:hypothetical protein